MVILQVYTKCIKTKYKVRLLSKGTLVFVLSGVFSIILPFIIAYKTKGFWLKRDVFYEFPDIRFKGKYLFMAETNDISHPIICSSYPLYLSEMKKFSACSQIKVRELDKNDDRKNDEFSMELKINLPNIEIYSFTLVIPFAFKLHASSCPLEMQTEVILQQQLDRKCSSIFIIGDLDMKQSSPLHCSNNKINTLFNYSLIENEKDIRMYKLENIIKRHNERNITTTISNIFTIQEAKNKNHLLLSIKFRYFEQSFLYQPKLSQILKWAWIQYYAIYIIVYFITSSIKSYIFEKRLVLYYEKNPIKLN